MTLRAPNQIGPLVCAALLAIAWCTCQGSAAADDLKAEKVYAWEFQRSEDRNIDQWPDGWRRRTGRNFPGYIPVHIASRDPAAAEVAREAEPLLSLLWLKLQTGQYWKNFIPESSPEPIAKFLDRYVIHNCLSVDMDGGAVELESPAFPLDPRFTYSLDASLASVGLEGHRAWIELLLLDERGGIVATGKSQEVTGTTNWHAVTTSSLSRAGFCMGQLALHVEPLKKATQLKGTLHVDEIRLYRMPKLELTVDVPHHVAAPDQPIDITCTVLGVSNARSTVSFKLINHLGQVTDQAVETLTPMTDMPVRPAAAPKTPSQRGVLLTTKGQPSPPAVKPPASPTSLSSKGNGQPSSQSGSSSDAGHRLNGAAHWQLRIPEPGYYRVSVDLGRTSQHSESRQISREISLSVIEGTRVGMGGPFGWSLPDFNSQFTPELVPELVKLGGVGWLKIPVWFDPRDVQSAERLSLLLDRLDLRKVNCVGLLDRQLSGDSQSKSHQPAAAVFSSPTDWEPQLEPALTRMSMKLSWFQLGRDNDRSFIGNPNLVPLVTDIRNRMQSYSPELQLALAWDYQDPTPPEKNLPWRASQMSSEPQLTSKELRSHISELHKPGHTHWITLNPISASHYRTLDRVRDLAERMMSIKEHKIEAAFITTPLDRDTGIFNPDGSAGELFLPWRLLNESLAGAAYLGSINMPGGSTNFVFSEGQSGVMILWNDRTAIEQLYLGDEVEATDLWGKPAPMQEVLSERQTPEQKLTVTPWPILLRGINVPVANWRMRFKVDDKSLPSILAARTELPISIENTLGGSAYGNVTLVAPTLLQKPANSSLQLGESEVQGTRLLLPIAGNASAGKHALRFDFQMNSDRPVNFSVYDSLTLGASDIELVWEAIEVTQERATLRVELINSAKRPVSYDCMLFPPHEPYRRFQITEAPPGTTVRDVVLPLSRLEPDATLQIRCEEIGTGRVLNYRVPLNSKILDQ